MEEVKVKCDNCSHKEVCRFKEQYQAVQNALDNIKTLDITNEEWLYSLEPNCKHYRPMSTIVQPFPNDSYTIVR